MIKINESKSFDDLFKEVCDALDEAKIRYSIRGTRSKMILVSRKDLDKASEIRNKIDPTYEVTVASQA